MKELGAEKQARLCREPWAEQSIPINPCPLSTTCCMILGSSFPLHIPPPCVRLYGVLSITVPSFLAAGPGASSRRRAVLLRSGRRGGRWRGRCSRSMPCAITSHLARPPLLQIHAQPQNPPGMGKRGPSHGRSGMEKTDPANLCYTPARCCLGRAVRRKKASCLSCTPRGNLFISNQHDNCFLFWLSLQLQMVHLSVLKPLTWLHTKTSSSWLAKSVLIGLG